MTRKSSSSKNDVAHGGMLEDLPDRLDSLDRPSVWNRNYWWSMTDVQEANTQREQLRAAWRVRRRELAFIERRIVNLCAKGLPQGEQRHELRALCQERGVRRRAYWRAGWNMACERLSPSARDMLRRATCVLCGQEDLRGLANGVCMECWDRVQRRRKWARIRAEARSLAALARDGRVVVLYANVSGRLRASDTTGELALFDPVTTTTLLHALLASPPIPSSHSSRSSSSTDVQGVDPATHAATHAATVERQTHQEGPERPPRPARPEGSARAVTPAELAPRLTEALRNRLVVTLYPAHADLVRTSMQQAGIALPLFDDFGIERWWHDVLQEPTPELFALATQYGAWPGGKRLPTYAEALWRCVQAIAEQPDEPPQEGEERVR